MTYICKTTQEQAEALATLQKVLARMTPREVGAFMAEIHKAREAEAA
jgi:hypothetical protein